MSDSSAIHLIGVWITDPQDVESLQLYGQVTMEFKEDRTLLYTVYEKGKTQIMLLNYKVEDGELITNQISDPREERTPFKFTTDGKLVLLYDNKESHYLRKG